MADDGDQIYVDIVPRLDEAAADEVEGKLRDKLKDAAKDLGENVKGAFDNLGDHVKDALSKDNIRDAVKGARDALGSDLGKEIVGELRQTVEKELGYTAEDVVQDWAKRAGGAIGGTLRDAIGGDNIDAVIDKTQKLTDIVRALRSHDFAGGVGGLNTLLGGNVPVLKEADDLLSKFDQIKSKLQETHDSGKEMAELFGGGALLDKFGGPLAKMIGPEAAILAAVSQTDPEHFGKDLPKFFDSLLGGNIPGILRSGGSLALDSMHDTPFNLFGAIPYPWELGPRTTSVARAPSKQDAKNQSDFFDQYEVGLAPQAPGRSAFTGAGGSGAVAGSGLHVNPDGVFAGAVGRENVTAQQAVVSAGAATISAGSLSIGGISLPGGRAPSDHAPTTTGAKSWFSSGGVLPGDSPGYDNMFGMLPGGRPIGLEGGEFVVNPDATRDHLELLRAINGGSMEHHNIGDLIGGGGGTDVHESGSPIQSVLGGGSQGKPNAAGQGPGAATSPMKAAGEPSPAQTIIPQGQGKGFGISGGILGGAEGAAAGAADMFAPGSGAAVQIGMQEANRAIEFGVKAGITAGIEAPLDTFWLSDSGLADPSHSWFGKLGLNLIGKTGGALQQNLAGLTQAPLTPGQGQGSPLGGQQKEAGPAIHIENQHNYSDTDHDANNRSLVNQMGAYQY